MAFASSHALATQALPRLKGSAVAALINDQQRLHLQHGPIDLLIDVDAPFTQKLLAYSAAATAFDGLLESLVSDLPKLKSLSSIPADIASECGKRMAATVKTVAVGELTPMAAVAGSVADYILAAIIKVVPDKRVLVNNGGDIAVHLGDQTACRIGIVTNPVNPAVSAAIEITHNNGVGGIATSGWGGRSLSLGIADSVTVLARSAAKADALATAIANKVNVATDQSWVKREPANQLDPDSDLGEQMVTVDVMPLPESLIDEALDNACYFISTLSTAAAPVSVCICLQKRYRLIGDAQPWAGSLAQPSTLRH